MASFDRSAGQALHSISAWPSCPTSSTWSSDALRITHLVVTRRRPSLLFPDCSLGQRGPAKIRWSPFLAPRPDAVLPYIWQAAESPAVRCGAMIPRAAVRDSWRGC